MNDPTRSLRASIHRLPLVVALAYAAVLLWSHASYVPIWDGRIYADCAVIAATRPFDIGALRCAEHPSQAYIGLLSLVQRLDPGNGALLLATNAALLLVGAVAFGRIVRAALPGDGLEAEQALLVAAFVVHPVVLASVVQPGLDFGALVFLMLATAAALERRVVAMALFGLLATFCKETGALVYMALVATYVAVFMVPRPVPRAVRTSIALAFVVGQLIMLALPATARTVALGGAIAILVARVTWPRDVTLRTLAPTLAQGRWGPRETLALLALPPVAYVAHLAYRAMHPQAGAVLWGGSDGASLAYTLASLHPDRVLASYLALLLVLGFQWIPALVILSDGAVGLARFARRRAARRAAGTDPDAALFVRLLAAGTAYIVTRYVTYSNVRYLLPAFPLLLVLAGVALLRAGVRPAHRRAILWATVVAFALSAVRTVDPVSRALWGTFPVGTHRLLRITSLTGECCGAGRDQLVYNLQFTAFARLVDVALARVQPVARHRTLVLSPLADWFVVGPLTPNSVRTLRPEAGVAEPVVRLGGPVASWPDTLWYLATPNAIETSSLAFVGRRYATVGVDTVRTGGYAMGIIVLARRDGIDSPVMPADVARTAPTPRICLSRVLAVGRRAAAPVHASSR